MTVVILVVKQYPKKGLTLILVVNSTVVESDDVIIETVKKHTRYHKIKSHNLTTSTLDMVIEVKLDKAQPLLHELLKIDGVTSASILSHDGDITA